MIKTKRLNIVPLQYEDFLDYINNRCGSIVSDEDAKWVKENHLFKMKSNDDLFCTFWLGLDSRDEVIAEGAFKGTPNEFGEIEIGCFVIEEYRGKGFGTELVEGMVDWAAKQPEVEFVLAGISPENKSSINVFKKNDFIYWGDHNSMQVYYKRSKN